MDKNTTQVQACAPTKIGDGELLRENEEKFKFCPSEKDMKKCLDGLPPFTYSSVVKYICTFGKSIQQSPDYMVMKPFECSVNFFIGGYLHRNTCM